MHNPLCIPNSVAREHKYYSVTDSTSTTKLQLLGLACTQLIKSIHTSQVLTVDRGVQIRRVARRLLKIHNGWKANEHIASSVATYWILASSKTSERLPMFRLRPKVRHLGIPCTETMLISQTSQPNSFRSLHLKAKLFCLKFRTCLLHRMWDTFFLIINNNPNSNLRPIETAAVHITACRSDQLPS